MPDIRIERTHGLGRDEARKITGHWVQEAREKFGLECTETPGDAQDVVTFARPGVSGTLRADAVNFELDVKLGFLLGAFKDRIEEEISRNLDTLLAGRRPASGTAPDLA